MKITILFDCSTPVLNLNILFTWLFDPFWLDTVNNKQQGCSLQPKWRILESLVKKLPYMLKNKLRRQQHLMKLCDKCNLQHGFVSHYSIYLVALRFRDSVRMTILQETVAIDTITGLRKIYIRFLIGTCHICVSVLQDNMKISQIF